MSVYCILFYELPNISRNESKYPIMHFGAVNKTAVALASDKNIPNAQYNKKQSKKYINIG